MAREKEKVFCASVCLGSREPQFLDKMTKSEANKNKNKRVVNPDFCENGFVAECRYNTAAETCYRWCEACEAKGKPVITKMPVNERLSESIKKVRQHIHNKTS